MRAFHNSRDLAFRAPYGVVAPETPVRLAIDIEGLPNAQAMLRLWVDGEGESLVPMERANANPDCGAENGVDGGTVVRFEATIVPHAPQTIWYHFIVSDESARTWRYGAQDGRFGGTGSLRDWEPPSFQLTVAEEGPANAAAPLPEDAVVQFLLGRTSALELAERLETARENRSATSFAQTLARLAKPSATDMLYQLTGLSRDEDKPCLENEDAIAGCDLGLAKGRLWCASLMQALAMPGKAADDFLEHAFPYGEEDDDCTAIVVNARDLRDALPAFSGKTCTYFALGEDVMGFWRSSPGRERVAVLINRSLEHAYDVALPLVDEEASEIIGGNAVDVLYAKDLPANALRPEDEGLCAPHAWACVHLYQLGTAVVRFHAAKQLGLPPEPGLGVLAHITSLPSGTLGDEAKAFVDLLSQADIRYWQVLPVNPTDEFGSPYAGISAFAGNGRLLDGTADMGEGDLPTDKTERGDEEFAAFCAREADWLDPYACFMAIRQKLSERGDASAPVAWQKWPDEYRRYDPQLATEDADLSRLALRWKRTQFAFQQQWSDLRTYANDHGVCIVGDMPIYVSADSADVWAHPEIFQLDEAGNPTAVAGCPPDAFAADGQIWGNPLYDWDKLAKTGYAWWLRRLERAFALYDYVRLDHFIGFARYFSIPAGGTAQEGTYRKGPGLAFFETASETFGQLPIIAEDLGLITPAVRALVNACGFPGMDIVQFADGNDPLAGYRPRPGKIAYTGTHDNQTLLGYAQSRYPELDDEDTARELCHAVVTSAAPVAIVPLQDVLGLGDEARMNTPGTAEGNWAWRATAEDMSRALPRLQELAKYPNSKARNSRNQ